MAQTPLDNVVAHWHKLIGNFETSSKDFYTSLELTLDQRKIPGLKVSRVKWSEGGILSPDREYLRVAGGRHSFDMCAAPFGTGFFFSSWATKRRARFVILYLVSFAILTVLLFWLLNWLVRRLSSGGGFLGLGMNFDVLFGWLVLLPLSFLCVLWLIGIASRTGNFGPEAALLTVPILGWFYEKVFAQETYYRIDTMLMFQSAVHSAMLEVIDGLTMQAGVRGLSDDDRKPIFHKLI